MQIEFVEVQNFRKLKSCRIDLTDSTTVFVGANNSGKTSAMDALIYFLGKRNSIATTDFTLSNWIDLNKIGKEWVTSDEDLSKIVPSEWTNYLPSTDVWLRATDEEVHYISHLIPTLDWEVGLLGVRFRLEPTKIERLYKDFRAAYFRADAVNKKAGNELNLWPRSLRDFLDRRLSSYFGIRAYLLDPNSYEPPVDGVPKPQLLPDGTTPIEGDPFNGLIKVSVITAQRGFSDPYSGSSLEEKVDISKGTLSSQLKEYYSQHLDPAELPDENDVGALRALKQAQDAFDEKLKESLTSALKELQNLGYPGFSDPKITISCKVNPIESLSHASAVQFDVIKDTDGSHSSLRLPEKYNGLGYQNLISMVFRLMRFRDEWMHVGKFEVRLSANEDDYFIEPLHLVLVEEPEAHLHAQVQQVFIRKAYEVLRNHKNLGDKKQFTTQLVISTHSSHIAHEIDFTCLRYFKRQPAINDGDVSCATIVSLLDTFGDETDTSRFATRYLKTTHCDIFFADAVILVEGAAERILLPHFIRNHFNPLAEGYISILEVSGSHAHRLKPLIESLGIIALIFTDLDSIDLANSRKSVRPEKGKGYQTGNPTLKTWLPKVQELDALLSSKELVHTQYPIRVAFQNSKDVVYKGATASAIPYTFEDALALENLDLISESNGTGLISVFKKAIAESVDVNQLSESLFNSLSKASKAAFALDLLFERDPALLKVPAYIRDGLTWLQDRLKSSQEQFSIATTLRSEGVPQTNSKAGNEVSVNA